MKLKYMIVGFIAGAIAATALTAGASTVYEKFTAVARPDYKLVVDGHEVKLNTPPKTIDGVTHLPIREVATILGSDVNFNSGTISLTTIKESEGDNVTTITWVPLRDVAVENGLQVGKTADSNGLFRVWKNDLVYFEFNPTDLINAEYVEVKAYNDSTVTIKLEDSHYYIDESDLSGLF